MKYTISYSQDEMKYSDYWMDDYSEYPYSNEW